MNVIESIQKLGGYLSAISAFSFWGLIPLYWREVSGYSSFVLLGHRVVWGALVLCLYLTLFRKVNPLAILKVPFAKGSSWLFVSSLLIGTNWFIFMYAVSVDKVVEASLGYFLNPLINVFLGLILFGERVSTLKWVSIGLAFIGLVIFSLGKLSSPGISLVLACTFALYGVLHKKSRIAPLSGLYIETIFLLVFLLPILAVSGHFPLGNFVSSVQTKDFLWLFAAGPVTIFPLLLFTFAVKRIPYSSIGIIQYLAPLGQFALGVTIFGQRLELKALIAFSLIWVALCLFSLGEYFSLAKGHKEKTP